MNAARLCAVRIALLAACAPPVVAEDFPVPRMTPKRTDVKPFEYVDVGSKIPHYVPGGQKHPQGEPLSRMQKPLPAEESQKHLVTPEGFEASLFAADPDIGKPLCMTWDERGRLWLAETVDYPNELQPPGKGRDRIRICEDTDGDGRADRFTVFAEKLSIPTALARYRGGMIVQNGVETIYLKDTDGDDRADLRRVLITGWAMVDTHGGVSNFHFGLDGWIWAMQGYNNSQPVIDGGPTQPFRMGFFRFRLTNEDPPRVTALEFLRSTNNNTWGLGFSEEGVVFGSTANRNPSVYMPIPNRYYERVRGWSAAQLGGIADTHLFRPITEHVRQVDHHGGYTAGAGHALYTARTYPRAYWNRTAFVCGPTGHLVGTFVLSGQGADFRSTSPFNLLASDDEWTAPIMAEVGPDGHVWVIDWYSFIVQHNPTPAGFKTGKGNAYESDLRDRKHGRIYRVVYRESKASPFTLKDAPVEKLVETLGHPTMLWRRHAQRLLLERGRPDVVPALIRLVENPDVDAVGLNVGAIHALWTLRGLGALEDGKGPALAAVHAALKHRSAGVRRNALQVVPASVASTEAILGAGLVADADAQVRLAALLALADMPASKKAGEAVALAMSQPALHQDRWLTDAAISAGASHAVPFLQALAGSGATPAAPVLGAARIVAEHVARGRPAGETGALLTALASADTHLAEAVIDGLARGWPGDHPPVLDARSTEAVGRLLTRLSPAARGRLIQLGRVWGSRDLERFARETAQALLGVIGDEKQPDEARATAARQLIDLVPEDGEMAGKVIGVVGPRTSPGLTTDLLQVAGASRARDVGTAIVARLAGMTPAQKSAALAVLLTRPALTRALLDGLAKGAPQASELALDQRQALLAHRDAAIAGRARTLLEQGGGLPTPDREKVVRELRPLAARKGDPARGKEVFGKHCAKCHVHGGEGTRIGPDLTGMAVHPAEELLTQVLDPSRSVEGNYRTYTVATADGRILTGMLASETRTTLEVIDAEGKKHVLQRADVEELVASPKSLMPEGFEKQLKPEEMVDLLAFLTRRGKYLPLDLGKVATIASTRGMFYSEEADAERLVFPDWQPRTFEGVPFHLVDPLDGRRPNVILLHGPQGTFPPRMPRSVSLPCNSPARAIHFLSGVSGWGARGPREKGTVSMIVRIHYRDGKSESHELYDGRHFADYIGVFDVPESKLAFRLRSQQIRYLAVRPRRADTVERIELIKGPDRTAPVVMAVTVETRE